MKGKIGSQDYRFEVLIEMLEIRIDIFPRYVPLFFTRQEFLEDYINDVYKALSATFPTRDDLIRYINSLDKPETAEFFIKISRYYLISKKHQPLSYVKLIMIISAIEKTISKDKKYQEFSFWIEKQTPKIKEELQKIERIDETTYLDILETLREDYFRLFGSGRNVIDFFQNHISKDYQIKLIRSFRAFHTKTISGFSTKLYKPVLSSIPKTIEEASERFNRRVEEGIMPYCYNWQQCYVGYGDCCPDFGCTLSEDPILLAKILRRVVKDLYQMRNDFVHTAKIVALNEKDSVGTLATIGADRKPVSISLTSEDLENMFESGLKHYFDQFAR